MKWPDKDPDDVLDYKMDWSRFLSSETISSSTWIVPDGITLASATNDSTSTTIWLSGGSSGASLTLTNRITTTAGRTMDQSVRLRIRNR